MFNPVSPAFVLGLTALPAAGFNLSRTLWRNSSDGGAWKRVLEQHNASSGDNIGAHLCGARCRGKSRASRNGTRRLHDPATGGGICCDGCSAESPGSGLLRLLDPLLDDLVDQTE